MLRGILEPPFLVGAFDVGFLGKPLGWAVQAKFIAIAIRRTSLEQEEQEDARRAMRVHWIAAKSNASTRPSRDGGSFRRC